MTDFLSETRLSLTTITLNRPSRRNSISSAMFDGMAAELNRLAADDTVRAVCFKGSDQLFSAGADLDELLKSPKTLTEAMTRFFDALERFVDRNGAERYGRSAQKHLARFPNLRAG